MTQTTTNSTTVVHIMALDGIVNVNSLFTVALFVGMVSVTSPIDASFTLNPSCTISSTSTTNPVPVSVPVPTSHHHHHNHTGHSHGGHQSHDDIQVQVQQHLHLDAYYSSMARNLVSFHVYSFASFLFSSLMASALKQAIKLTSSAHKHHMTTSTTSTHDGGLLLIARANRRLLRAGILASSVGSVSGCVFLVLAMVDLVQIKLGSVFSCTNLYNLGAVVPLLLLVPLSLVAYVCIVLHAFAH